MLSHYLALESPEALTSHKTRQNRVPRESFPILAGCLDVPCAVLPIDHVIPRPQVAT